jgi:drug/metabolite transporter (DMT)-like permease
VKAEHIDPQNVVEVSTHKAKDRQKIFNSSAFAVAVGTCSATYSTVDAFGVRHIPPLTYSFLFNFWANLILFPYLYKYYYEDCLAAYQQQKLTILQIAPGVVGSYLIILVVFSISDISVAVVVVLRSSSVLMGCVLGVVFLKERYSNIKFTAVFIIMIGVVVIKFG